MLLARCEGDPLIEERLLFSAQLHQHGVFSKKLRQGDPESITDALQRCDGRDGVPLTDIGDGGGEAGLMPKSAAL